MPVGARSFNVVSAKGFKAGDKVLVRRIGNQDWIKEIGEDSVAAGRNRWRPFNITLGQGNYRGKRVIPLQLMHLYSVPLRPAGAEVRF